MTRQLDLILLDRYEAELRRQGAEIAGVLAPGLDADVANAKVAPLGLTLPAEALTWWGWHDGVTSTSVFGWELGPDVGFFSLDRAVEEHRRVTEVYDPDAEFWSATWLPLTDFGSGMLAIDCSGADLASVRRIDWGVGEFEGPASMAEMVHTWLAALEVGAWSWNREAGSWDRWEPEQIPADLMDTGVV